jgi:hypothetical protein
MLPSVAVGDIMGGDVSSAAAVDADNVLVTGESSRVIVSI